MCRIISFVSAAGGLGKSSLINLLASSLSQSGFSVCVFDGVFALNTLSTSLGKRGMIDLSLYLAGNINSYLALNKVNENLYFIKTDDASFDYLSKAELITKFVSDISFNFDYILIETSSYDTRNISLFLSLSSEAIVVITQEINVIENTKKLIKKIDYYKNITNKKLILNKQKVIGEFKGKYLGEKAITNLLCYELLFTFPKFLKHNIFEYKNHSPYYNYFSEEFKKSILQNRFVPTKYKNQYRGILGSFRRKLYEKYE